MIFGVKSWIGLFMPKFGSDPGSRPEFGAESGPRNWDLLQSSRSRNHTQEPEVKTFDFRFRLWTNLHWIGTGSRKFSLRFQNTIPTSEGLQRSLDLDLVLGVDLACAWTWAWTYIWNWIWTCIWTRTLGLGSETGPRFGLGPECGCRPGYRPGPRSGSRLGSGTRSGRGPDLNLDVDLNLCLGLIYIFTHFVSFP